MDDIMDMNAAMITQHNIKTMAPVSIVCEQRSMSPSHQRSGGPILNKSAQNLPIININDRTTV